ncbi:MAG: isocitrate lyase/phosphoenolpyruvate mutase family protein [Congregibacter sp.]
MTQEEKAQRFRALHSKSEPIVLYNIWDAGSTRAVTDAGAKAIATGSWSVAAANGYQDGQKMPLDLALGVASMIVASTDLPVTVDFEGAYASHPKDVAHNVALLMQTGAVGLNFEDQIVGGQGIHSIETQTARIQAARDVARIGDAPAVINARTDLFLQENDARKHVDLVADAINRANAYSDAGADCFFIPGLVDTTLIGEICATVALPVNVMVADINTDLSSIVKTGVARISFGPAPYFAAMAQIKTAAENAL